MAEIVLSIDLGSSVTKIYQVGSGIVLNEASAVSYRTQNGKKIIKSIGDEAKRLVGKTPENTFVAYPIVEGVIVDEELATIMLGEFLKKIEAVGFFKRVSALFSVPCGITNGDLLKYAKVARNLGIKAYFAPSSILSAIGNDVSLNHFTPCFIVDVGGGSTNVAAVSLDGVIAGISIGIGGGNIDASIIDFIVDRFKMKVGVVSAEKIKIQIGSLIQGDNTSAIIQGRDIINGTPKSTTLKSSELYDTLEKCYSKIIAFVQAVLKKLPAEVSADIIRQGIYLAGGSSQMPGVKEYFNRELKLDVNTPENPSCSAVIGGGLVFGNKELFNKIKLTY